MRREEEDKEDNAEDEEAVMKARAVDDWKDYNPCGACNQKLTTCDLEDYRLIFNTLFHLQSSNL